MVKPPDMPSSLASFATAAIVLIVGAWAASTLGAPWSSLLVMIGAAMAALVAVTLGRADDPKTALSPPSNRLRPGAVSQPLYLHPGFDELINALPFPILVVQHRMVASANQTARDLLGGFIIGTDVRVTLRHPAAADQLARSQSEHNTDPIDLTGIGHPGQRFEMQIMPMVDGIQMVALWDQSARDAVERMRADFVANASHELRTPLATIIGYVETLLDEEAWSDGKARRRFLATVNTEAHRMLTLVEDLMSISRIEASKADRPTETVDLAQLTHTVVGELLAGGDPRAAAITLTTSAAAVYGDTAQLAQLVHNLVTNAMKYGRDTTPIMVTVAVSNGMADLAVADQGEGIAPQQLPRLTERFYRVDSARSRVLGGTGLGLAIVKHVVNRHRGRLDIDSVVGTGTTVRVRLPLANP